MENFTVRKDFQNVVTKTFKSESQSLNFADKINAANTINSWVEEKTNDKIKNLIAADTLDEDDRLVLVNAMHFKGTWRDKFCQFMTCKDPFYINDQDTVEVDFMNNSSFCGYRELSELNASAIELPYKGSDISMLIILPDSKTGLADLESKLHTIDIQELSGKWEYRSLILQIPKFKAEFDINLNEPLMKVRTQIPEHSFTELITIYNFIIYIN